jgi:hypothetical protein
MPPRRRAALSAAATAQGSAASPAEAVFAAAELAERLASHLAAVATPEELARADGACAALHSALTPHWRALCEALSPAAVRLAGAAPKWRSLYRQLRRTRDTPLRPPRHVCAQFTFTADVWFDGALLYSASFDMLHHTHFSTEPCEHRAAIVDECFSAGCCVTAGDLYDRPQALTATVYAHRSDGAVACLCRGAEGSTEHALASAWEMDEEDEDEPRRVLKVSFRAPLPGVATRHISDRDLELEVLFRAADDTGDAAQAVEPLFFHAPGFQDREAYAHSNDMPRRPLYEQGTGVMHFPSGGAPIPEAVLARRVVVCDSPHEEKAVISFQAEFSECSCMDLCTSLEMMRWELP